MRMSVNQTIGVLAVLAMVAIVVESLASALIVAALALVLLGLKERNQ